MRGKNKYAPFIPSVAVAAACIVFHALGCGYLLEAPCGIAAHALYSFTHANVFHLALNLLALFRFRPRWKTCAVAYVAAFAGSFLPFVCLPGATCGLSGFLMACFARYYRAWRKPVWPLLCANLVFIFVPCVNWLIHLACFTLSYLFYACTGRKPRR